MKLVTQIIVALLALIILLGVVQAVLGHLIGAVVIILLGLGAAGIARMVFLGREQKRGPDLSNVKRAEKAAEKQLRQMEREAKKTGTNR
jgi:hypothetical protein